MEIDKKIYFLHHNKMAENAKRAMSILHTRVKKVFGKNFKSFDLNAYNDRRGRQLYEREFLTEGARGFDGSETRGQYYRAAVDLGYRGNWNTSTIPRLNKFIRKKQDTPIGVRVTIHYATIPDSMNGREIENFDLNTLTIKQKRFIIRSTNATLDADIENLIQRFKEPIVGYVLGSYENGEFYHVITEYNHETTRALPQHTAMTIPLKDRHSPRLVTFNNDGEILTKYINNLNDQCVIDYIYDDYILRYSQNKKLGILNNKSRIPYMSREKIGEVISDLYNEENSSLMACPVHSWCDGCEVCNKKYDALIDGVNVYQLELFCKKYSISLRVCDKDNRCFHSWICQKNNGIEPMMIISTNGHLYPIVDKKFRKSLGNSGRYSKNKRDKKGNVEVKQYEKCVPEKYQKISDKLTCHEILDLANENPMTCFVFETEKIKQGDFEVNILQSIWLDLLCERNEYYQHGFKATDMTEIFLPNKCSLVINRDYDKVMDCCSKSEIAFENQSLLKISNDNFKNYSSLEELSSNFNKETYKCIKNDMPVGNWVEQYWKASGRLEDHVALDFNKMYSSILEDIHMEWIKLDITSQVMKFNGVFESNKLYYVNTKRQPLFVGGIGWYFPDLVHIGLKDGLIKLDDILYEIAGDIKYHDFNTFVEYIYETFGNFLGKELLNPFIGNLGKSHSQIGKQKWTTSLEHACTQFCNQTNDTFVFEQEHKGKTVYCMENSKLVERRNQTLLIHRQIVQTGWIKVYNLIKDVGGILVSVNTDCIVVKDPIRKNIRVSKDRGGYKHEKISPDRWKRLTSSDSPGSYWGPVKLRPTEYDTSQKPIPKIFVEDEWNTASVVDTIVKDSKNILLTGRAGCGKTLVTQELIKQLRTDGKLVKCGAPTHIARRLMDEEAHTVHGLFGHDIIGKVHTVKFNDKQVVVIDEVSMMGIAFWREIVKLRRTQPDIIFILVGDFNQLRAVGEEHIDVYMSEFLRDTVDVHLDLVENKRCTEDGKLHYDIMTSAINGESIDYPFPSGDLLDKNLCYTNRTRIRLNERLMNKYRDDDSLFIPTVKPEEDEDIFTYQDMWIYEGLPVRCKKNHKISELRLYNGDMLVVKSYDDKQITLQRDYDGELITITNIPDFPYVFYPNYASTIHSCQGQTFDKEYCLHEFYKYDSRLLYVALSRTTNLKNIHVKN